MEKLHIADWDKLNSLTPHYVLVGIATQKEHLRSRIKINKLAQQLNNFFRASTGLMQVMARACGHDRLDRFCVENLTTWKREMAHLTGIAYGGVSLGLANRC